MALAMTACGFQPVHGRQERAERSAQLESIRIVTDNTRAGQLLQAEIEDQVNPGSTRAEKPFQLKVAVNEIEISLFINPDGTSGRGDMQYSSTYLLTRARDGAIIDTGSITRTSSYNISETADYATYVSREDARKRGITELGQDYKLRLANLLHKLNNPVTGPLPEPEPAAAPLIRPQDNHENRPTRY